MIKSNRFISLIIIVALLFNSFISKPVELFNDYKNDLTTIITPVKPLLGVLANVSSYSLKKFIYQEDKPYLLSSGVNNPLYGYSRISFISNPNGYLDYTKTLNILDYV